jgi:hypothetical protein
MLKSLQMITSPFIPARSPSVSVLLVTEHCMINSAIETFFRSQSFVLVLPKSMRIPNVRRPLYTIRGNAYFGGLFAHNFGKTGESKRFCVFADESRVEAFVRFAKTEVIQRRASCLNGISKSFLGLAPLCIIFFRDKSLSGSPVNVKMCQPSFDALYARRPI